MNEDRQICKSNGTNVGAYQKPRIWPGQKSSVKELTFGVRFSDLSIYSMIRIGLYVVVLFFYFLLLYPTEPSFYILFAHAILSFVFYIYSLIYDIV